MSALAQVTTAHPARAGGNEGRDFRPRCDHEAKETGRLRFAALALPTGVSILGAGGPETPMLDAPRFIGSEIYRRSRYGTGHPLAIPRVSTVIDLSRALGWLPDDQYLDSPVARPDELARFHDRDYIAALVAAESAQSVSRERRRRYNIGCNGNPVFPEIFRRPATACGGSLLGAALIRDGGTVYTIRPAAPITAGPTGRADSATSTTRRWPSCGCLTRAWAASSISTSTPITATGSRRPSRKIPGS
jgi:hypothetical protein